MGGPRKVDVAARAQKAPKEGQATYLAPALEKGLDVLELLARQSEGLTQSQIAQQLSVTGASLCDEITCREDEGERVADGGRQRVQSPG